jgi:hypothetical protein
MEGPTTTYQKCDGRSVCRSALVLGSSGTSKSLHPWPGAGIRTAVGPGAGTGSRAGAGCRNGCITGNFPEPQTRNVELPGLSRFNFGNQLAVHFPLL